MLAARRGAIEDRQMLVLEERRAFERHAAADGIRGFVDLLRR